MLTPRFAPQWTTRDTAARLAVRRHLPTSERAHFSKGVLPPPSCPLLLLLLRPTSLVLSRSVLRLPLRGKRRTGKGKGGKGAGGAGGGGGGGSGGGGGGGGGGGAGRGSTQRSGSGGGPRQQQQRGRETLSPQQLPLLLAA
ncbi:unnamed protein product [Closterium sp. NIES-65]|nr:unnamed protein product [Closterium sp. NIES-65]